MVDHEGDRLIAQGARLRLLLGHLAGPALRARVPVEDLLQETYLRALATGSLPTEPADLYRYLVTVARHCVVDAVRTLRARKRLAKEVRLAHSDWSVGGVRASQILRDTLGPATRVENAEIDQRLSWAFDALAPDHRRVLGLRQFEGRSAAETAERMGRSETAVHSLFRRALLAWEEAARTELGEAGG